ncbi:MAG: DNA-directed RNA polymerase subunit H [Candidatus Diapherotrites archaeon]|nr:DNA-directed RNA polymerase subunit H [Candidatus Diapherotrites archaeon]
MASKKRSILDHVFVPKARILSKEEVEEVLRKYRVSKENLPKILETDPVVVELGAKKGDVIEFIRNSPVAGKSIYYRVVI